MKRRNRHIGSSFEDFLIEEGIHEEVTIHAWKRILAWQVSEAMEAEGISKNQMAKRMNTSRIPLNGFRPVTVRVTAWSSVPVTLGERRYC